MSPIQKTPAAHPAAGVFFCAAPTDEAPRGISAYARDDSARFGNHSYAIRKPGSRLTSAAFTVDCHKIKTWDMFHDAFDEAFGFQDGYGRNMSAWIDQMTRLDEVGPSAVSVPEGELVILNLANADALKRAAPEILAEILDSAAFVNWRRIDIGLGPILIVSGYA